MAATLSFSISGAEKIVRKLQLVSQRTSDMRPAFEKTGDFLVKTYQENIDRKGAKIGNQWEPRTWSYPHPILNKTGRLKAGFKKEKVTKFSVEVKNPVEYAAYHHFGTRGHGPTRAKMLRFEGGDGRIIFAKWVKGLPARPLIGLSKIIMQDIIEIFNKFLNEAIKK